VINTEHNLIMRKDLQEHLHVTADTLRRWIKSQRIPKPDVQISTRTMGWRRSTLEEFGLVDRRDDPPKPGASSDAREDTALGCS
jgi:predicted DNA-binding transcriptional regulator AlpA